MEITTAKEYHKFGCNFYGNLVIVNYQKDMENDPKWERWNSGVVYDYVDKAEGMVVEKFGKPVEVLLAIPEYVCIVS